MEDGRGFCHISLLPSLGYRGTKPTASKCSSIPSASFSLKQCLYSECSLLPSCSLLPPFIRQNQSLKSLFALYCTDISKQKFQKFMEWRVDNSVIVFNTRTQKSLSGPWLYRTRALALLQKSYIFCLIFDVLVEEEPTVLKMFAAFLFPDF